MTDKTAAASPRTATLTLTYTDMRSYLFTAVFVSLSVLVPWAFHQFQLAGATFLPMHIFVLVAGLFLGWRAGLVVGAVTPLVSYGVSGMPALTVLPQIVVELSAYGLVSGLLREKLNLPVIGSLLGAMAAGRLAMCGAVFALYLGTGAIFSPMGPASSPLAVVWATVAQGWPGIILQLALIPSIIWLLGKLRIKLSRSPLP